MLCTHRGFLPLGRRCSAVAVDAQRLEASDRPPRLANAQVERADGDSGCAGDGDDRRGLSRACAWGTAPPRGELRGQLSCGLVRRVGGGPPGWPVPAPVNMECSASPSLCLRLSVSASLSAFLSLSLSLCRSVSMRYIYVVRAGTTTCGRTTGRSAIYAPLALTIIDSV